MKDPIESRRPPQVEHIVHVLFSNLDGDGQDNARRRGDVERLGERSEPDHDPFAGGGVHPEAADHFPFARYARIKDLDVTFSDFGFLVEPQLARQSAAVVAFRVLADGVVAPMRQRSISVIPARQAVLVTGIRS